MSVNQAVEAVSDVLVTPLLNKVRTLVSRDKQRYIKDGFNLDLTYITDQIIGMIILISIVAQYLNYRANKSH